MTTAAIYTRISHDPTGLQAATSRQEVACRQLCVIRGWEVVRAFEDVDVSAYSGEERPAFVELRKAIVCGDVEVVVVWKLDRLVRRPVDFEAFWSIAEEAGVGVVSATEPIDTTSEFGLAMVRVLVAMASMESATSGLRLRARFAQRLADGMPPLGGNRAFGHTKDRLELVPEEAELIREAARRVVDGETCYSIAKDWTDRGITTTGGGTFNTSGLRHILLSDRIVGDSTHLGQVVAREVFPAIMDRFTHARVREELTRPDRRNFEHRRPRGLLTRGLLRCGVCGTTLHASTSANVKERPRIYMCATRGALGCGGVTIRMDRADQAVAAAVFARLEVMHGFELGRPSYGADEELILLEAIADTNRRLHDAAIDCYCYHRLDQATFQVVAGQLRSRLDRLRRRLRSPALHLITSSNPSTLRDRWDDLDPDDKRLAINALLDHATVLPATKEGRAEPALRLRYAWHHPDVQGRTTPPRWTEHDALGALRRWRHEGGDGRIVSYSAWAAGRPDAPSAATVTRLLGPWPSAWSQAQLTQRVGPWTDVEILEAVRRWRCEGDRSLRGYRDWSTGRSDAPSARTVLRRFGSWRNVVQEVGATEP